VASIQLLSRFFNHLSGIYAGDYAVLNVAVDTKRLELCLKSHHQPGFKFALSSATKRDQIYCDDEIEFGHTSSGS